MLRADKLRRQAGELRDRVALLSVSNSPDSLGHAVQSFSLLAWVWAAVHPVGAYEPVQAGMLFAACERVLRCRWRGDVRSEQRALVTRAATSLTAGVDADDTSIAVASNAAAGPAGHGDFYVAVESELMRVSAGHAGLTWTVTRGALGSTAAAHSSGAAVMVMELCEINGVVDVEGRGIELLAGLMTAKV